MKKNLQAGIFLLCLINSLSVYAQQYNPKLDLNSDRIHLHNTDTDEITVAEPYDMNVYDQAITNFYQNPNKNYSVMDVANYFLNQPYFLEPLGEGVSGNYSQEPIYRTDKFDCVSYVDTVLAMINAKNLPEFKINMSLIRYSGAPVDYINRTDWFTDLEWIPNAERLGWIKDVTWQVVDKNQQPIALMAETIIDKPNWYKVKPLKVMHLFAPLPPPDKAQALLQDLQAKGSLFQAQPSQLAYLPLSKLFDEQGNANNFLFDQIPSGSVVAIVRPNWEIRDNFPGFPHGYGTNLNVSHLGIAIRTDEGLMFYNASSLHHKVEYEPFTQYLKKYIDSPTIKGIHIEQIIQH